VRRRPALRYRNSLMSRYMVFCSWVQKATTREFMRSKRGIYKLQSTHLAEVTGPAERKCIRVCFLASLSFFLIHNTYLCLLQNRIPNTKYLRSVFCPKYLTRRLRRVAYIRLSRYSSLASASKRVPRRPKMQVQRFDERVCRAEITYRPDTRRLQFIKGLFSLLTFLITSSSATYLCGLFQNAHKCLHVFGRSLCPKSAPDMPMRRSGPNCKRKLKGWQSEMMRSAYSFGVSNTIETIAMSFCFTLQENTNLCDEKRTLDDAVVYINLLFFSYWFSSPTSSFPHFQTVNGKIHVFAPRLPRGMHSKINYILENA
jgi:hypothetical protein